MTLPMAVEPRLSLFVRGIPQPKGSKRGFVVKRKHTGKLQAVVVDDSKKTMRQWEGDIRRAVQETWVGPPLEGPVAMTLNFVFLHLKSAPKRHPPIFKDTGPDWDKLSRVVGDAMEGIVYRNDGQIASVFVATRYGPEAGVHITVSTLPTREEVAPALPM